MHTLIVSITTPDSELPSKPWLQHWYCWKSCQATFRLQNCYDHPKGLTQKPNSQEKRREAWIRCCPLTLEELLTDLSVAPKSYFHGDTEQRCSSFFLLLWCSAMPMVQHVCSRSLSFWTILESCSWILVPFLSSVLLLLNKTIPQINVDFILSSFLWMSELE